MIPGLFLLSVSVFATPVFISEVKAVREAGHLRVEVVGDGGIDPEGVRTNIDDGRLFMYLGGTRVRADNRAWDLEDGAGEIRAHRHKTETELVVPLAGNGCAGPVELSGSNTGITALVGCDGTVGESRSGSNTGAKPARKSGLKAASKIESNTIPVPIVAMTKAKEITAKPSSEAETLRALIELPAPAPSAANTRVAPESEHLASPVVVPAGPPAVAPVVVPIAAPSRGASAATTSAAPPAVDLALPPAALPARVPSSIPAASVAVAPSPVTRSKPTGAPVAGGVSPTLTTGSSDGAGLGKVAIPALLLAALAVAAYLFARRRRGAPERHIHILESASLGPKRSLVIARVGDQTLILGSSEAGITLLRASPTSEFGAGVPDVAADLATSAKELSQTIEEALADIPEPDQAPAAPARSAFRTIEGGLASLFGQRGTTNTDKDKKESSLDFDDLLEDSVEDQELRQKLAAGISARVR
jgi:flagellar protein FliO/FliZ